MASERRVAPRFSIQQMVELSYGREEIVHASGINLSKTGLLCSTDSYVEPYTEVSLLMQIPESAGEHRIECEGIVVRSEERNGRFVTGISFTSLPEEDAKALAGFLKAHGHGADSD